MSAIVRPVLSRKALAFALLSNLPLLLALACGPADSPVTPEPQVPTSTSVAGSNVQTPGEAATPTPAPTSTIAPTAAATTTDVPKGTGYAQAKVNDSKGTSDPIAQTGSGAASNPRNDATSGDNQAPPIPDKGELKYPNLGSRLDQLVARVEAGQATSQDAASNSPVHSGESVAVTIYLSGGVDEVVVFLEENGGDPRNVGEDYIEAYVPVTLLGAASEQRGVLRVREIVPPERERGG